MTSPKPSGRDKNTARKALPRDAGTSKSADPAAAAAPRAGQQSGKPGMQQSSKFSGQANRSNKDMPGREPSRNGKR